MKYVRNCNSCQRFKVQQKQPTGTMHATNVTQLWKMVSTDLVGPFPRSKMGNFYLLVSQDSFSKWVELCALQKATAHAICQVIKDICPRHGCPRRTAHRTSMHATVHAAMQPPVERTNRVIKTMVRQYIDRSQTTWDKYIQEIAFAYNTAPSESTGFSRAYMNYGRELTPPQPEPRSGAAFQHWNGRTYTTCTSCTRARTYQPRQKLSQTAGTLQLTHERMATDGRYSSTT